MNISTKALRDSSSVISNSANKTINYNGMNIHSAEDCPICGRPIYKEAVEEEDIELELLASNVITDPNRRFISDEWLYILKEIYKFYMRADIYDSDKNGIVDYSERAKEADSVDWNNIKYRPNIDADIIQKCIEYLHHHLNKESLDMLSHNPYTNNPMWNNEEWPYPKKATTITLQTMALRNFYIGATEPLESNDGDFWLQIDNNTNRIKSINIRKNSIEWYILDTNDLITLIANRISDNIIDDHEELYNLQGGSYNQHYHLTKEEYLLLQEIIEQYKNPNIIPSELDGGPAPNQKYIADYDGGFAGTTENEYELDFDGGFAGFFEINNGPAEEQVLYDDPPYDGGYADTLMYQKEVDGGYNDYIFNV